MNLGIRKREIPLVPTGASGRRASPLGAGAQRADVGAGLRLGKLHGAGPFAGNESFQIDLFQLLAAMGVERLDGGERQERAETEGDVRRTPDFGAGRVDRHR
jgi:hypothetical protein